MSFDNFKNEDNKVALAMDLKNEKRNNMTIQYSKEVSDFIENNSTKINKYFFLPHWYRKVGEGLFEIVTFENLPKEVTDFINENRER